MRITITLQDQENGHVDIKTDPPLQKIWAHAVQASKGVFPPTPAMAYAIDALNAMFQTHREVEQNQTKDRNLILPKGVGLH